VDPETWTHTDKTHTHTSTNIIFINLFKPLLMICLPTVNFLNL
jgi:hypothetical protein